MPRLLFYVQSDHRYLAGKDIRVACGPNLWYLNIACCVFTLVHVCM